MTSPDEAVELLRAAYAARDAELRERWNRSLSLEDALVDRWDRARTLGFGEGASIYGSALVYGDVAVGEQTWVGPFCLLDGSGGGLTVGSWCSISAGVHLYTHDTVLWALSAGREEGRSAPVRIGDSTYVGPQTVVAAGVTIGSQCVVGANSFVNADVPDRTVVAGSPARVIGKVEVDGDSIEVSFDRS